MTPNPPASTSLRLLVAAAVAAVVLPAPQPASADGDRLTPKDIAVAEPLQVPLSAAKPATEAAAGKDATQTDGATTSDPPATTADDPPAPSAAGDASPPVAPPAVAGAAAASDGSSPPQPASPPPTVRPTSGWLGLIVDDSLVTGRLVVAEVTDPSPAWAAGVRPRDVLLAIDGEPLQTADQLAAVLAAIPPKKQVRALIGRTDGVKEVTMTASVRPAVTKTPATVALEPGATRSGPLVPAAPPTSRFRSSPPQAAQAPASKPAGSRFAKAGPAPAPLPVPQAAPLPAAADRRPTAAGEMAASVPRGRTALGVRTVAIDPATQARYRLPEPSGAYVLGVVESLPASRAGLPPGSVIVAFDNRPVRSPEDLTDLVTASRPGRQVSLEFVLPGGEARRADIELQALEPALERALIGVPAGGTIPAAETARRPLSPAVPRLPASSSPSAAPGAELSLLQQELQLLREELLRVRNRLDRLESGRPAGGRPRGETLR